MRYGVEHYEQDLRKLFGAQITRRYPVGWHCSLVSKYVFV
jgi:hypothetical protein